jgi:hypothetical protein
MGLPFVLFALTLLVSTFLMHIGVILLTRVLFHNSHVPVLMLRMVLLSVSIAIFLRQLVLFSFLLIWLPTFGLRLFPQLFFLLIDSPPLLLRDLLPTNVFSVLHLPMTISVALVVSATFFFHLVSAPS